MKKISVFLLTLVLSLMALVGCNEEKELTPVPPTDGPTEVVPPTDGPTEVVPPETETPAPVLGENALAIQAEYDALKAGTTTEHTTWTVTGKVVDMSATTHSEQYGNYNIKLIIEFEGLYIGIYNGQIGGKYPGSIAGLEVGTELTATGTIAEKYDLTSGEYYAAIEFSKPEISWDADLTKSGIYLRGTFNEWGTPDQHELKVSEAGLGNPSITVYFAGGESFKVATSDWSTVNLGYAEALGENFAKDGNDGNIKVVNGGYYEISVVKGALVITSVVPGYANQDMAGADGAGVWTEGQEIKATTGFVITNGWRLFVAVDADGCIAYMVYMPLNGYGGAMETSYARHSKYADYKTNPAFKNISDVYEGKWGPTVDYSLVAPEGGFMLTCNDEVIVDLISKGIVGQAYDGDAYNALNSSSVNVDNVRVHYNEETGNITFEHVEPAPEVSGSVSVVIADYAAANSWANGTLYESIVIDANTTASVTASNPNSRGQNTGKYYTSDQTWRTYQTEVPTITITSTKTIASVVVEYLSGNSGVLVVGETAYESGSVLVVNGNTVSFGVTQSTPTDSANGQGKITKITVNYAE